MFKDWQLMAITAALAVAPAVFAQNPAGSSGQTQPPSRGTMAPPQDEPQYPRDQTDPRNRGMSGTQNPSEENPNMQSAHRLTADTSFMTKAAEGGMAEVQLGQLATTKGTSEAVKTFGQKMVDDHTKANNELKDLAGKKGVSLPTSLAAKDQSFMEHLSRLNGAEFDKTYMDHMVQDHRTDVSEFQREAQHGTDPEVKAFAAKTLPVLQNHLQMAETTDAKLKK